MMLENQEIRIIDDILQQSNINYTRSIILLIFIILSIIDRVRSLSML